MTTQQFIEKHHGVASARERRCSSVFADHQGNIYSYGYHYPLLWTIGGLHFVNIAGYSNSTAKHINWAKAATNYNYVGVELPSRSGWSGAIDYTLGEMATLLKGQIEDVEKRMDAKKRKDTQVFWYLQQEHDRLSRDLATVQEAL